MDIRRCRTLLLGSSDPGEATNGYILVNANGGLNQMRSGVRATTFSLLVRSNQSIDRLSLSLILIIVFGTDRFVTWWQWQEL